MDGGDGFMKAEEFLRIAYDNLTKDKSQARYHRKIEFA